MTTSRPALYPRYSLMATNPDGSRVDLTGRLHHFEFRYGSRFQNEVGHLASPFSGSVRLRNNDGRLSPMGNPIVSPYPGVILDLHCQYLVNNRVFNILLFSAWSACILEADTAGTTAAVDIPLEGALARIAGRHSRLYNIVFSDLRTGRLIDSILTNVGWPTTRRRIQTGRIVVNEGRGQGLTSGGRDFQDTLSRLELICQAEGGYSWDDYQGNVVFQDYDGRRAPKIAIALDNSQIQGYNILNSSESIINSIVSESNEVEVGTLQAFDDVLKPALPFTRVIPAGQTREFFIEADDEAITFIQSVNQPVEGSDYSFLNPSNGQRLPHTLDPVSIRTLRRYGLSVTIRNESTLTGAFTLRNLNGIIGGDRNIIGLRTLEPIEHAASVRRYGLKDVSFVSGKIFTGTEQVHNRLQEIIDEHNGIDTPPLDRVDVRGQVTFHENQEMLTARVGQDCVLENGVAQLSQRRLFHIDEVSHEWTIGQVHNVTLSLTRATGPIPGPTL